jgi:hypothetical protein
VSEEQAESTLILERAVFGKQVEAFFNTEIGQYILHRAQDQQSDALTKLKICDPENPNVVRKLQNDAKVAESIVQWLEDAIADGLQAIKILDDRE